MPDIDADDRTVTARMMFNMAELLAICWPEVSAADCVLALKGAYDDVMDAPGDRYDQWELFDLSMRRLEARHGPWSTEGVEELRFRVRTAGQNMAKLGSAYDETDPFYEKALPAMAAVYVLAAYEPVVPPEVMALWPKGAEHVFQQYPPRGMFLAAMLMLARAVERIDRLEAKVASKPRKPLWGEPGYRTVEVDGEAKPEPAKQPREFPH